MHAPKERLRLYVLLFIIGLPFAANAAEDPSAIGAVDRVENEAKIVAGDAVTPAKIGTPVHLRDELRTGPEGRLRVTFRDDTLLTLGENASVVVDRYVYDPRQSVGQTVIQTTKGAFLFASGCIKGLKQHYIAVSTPVADIGVGTQFWGGPLDKYGVLVLEGEITVSNQAGKVTLSGGHRHPLAPQSARRGQALERREDCPRRGDGSPALGIRRRSWQKPCNKAPELENPAPCGGGPVSLGCGLESRKSGSSRALP